MSQKVLKWESLIDDYKVYLTVEKKLSENSIENYTRDIKKVKDYFLEKYPKSSPSTINSEEILQFLYDAVKDGYSERTQARFISTIKSCCKFLLDENYRKDNPAELLEPPRISRKSRDILQIEEIYVMIKSIPLNSEEGKRNRAIIEVLYSCGLRVSELINLQLSDVHFEEGFISVMGKGNKRRFVPLNLECKKLLKIYFEEVRDYSIPKKNHENFCFLSKRNQKFTRFSINNIVTNLCKKAGVHKKITPHTFRHSLATHLLSRGADIRAVQQILGHEHIATTDIYNHNSLSHLRKTISKFHPLENRPL